MNDRHNTVLTTMEVGTGKLAGVMLDQKARAEAIQQINRLLDGDRGVHLNLVCPSRRRDRDLHDILRELADSVALQLPVNPGGERMPPSLRRELERAALFLQTDREYIDPDAGWHWSGVVLTTGLALCLIGLIGSGAGEERLPPVAVTVLKVMAAVGGVMFLGPLFLVYTLGLMMQAFHIVRVRVLRQDLGERDVERQDECWPFTTREDYLEAKARLIDEPRRA